VKSIPQRLVVFFCCVFVLATLPTRAQTTGSSEEKEPSKGFLALKANLVEWAVAIPNLSLMTDLSAKPWNRSVAGVTLKYKWPTTETYVPSYMLDLLEVRPEYRYYRNRFYYGGYAAYDLYTTKLPSRTIGWKGFAVGGGLSAGWEFPLYQYRKSAIDLELGLSVGAHYTDFQDFSVSEDGLSTLLSETHTRTVRPYPELRVALVWRKTSVKDKYNQTNPMDKVYDSELESILINYDVTNKENFDALRQSDLKVYQKSVFMDLYEGDAAAYRADFEQYLQESFVDIALDSVEQARMDEKRKNKLRNRVAGLQKKALEAFDKAVREESTLKTD